jgi:hypothetical protein
MQKDIKNVTDAESRKTAFVVVAVLIAAAALFWYRGRITAAVVSLSLGCVLAFVGMFVPPLAKLFHRGWFRLAFALGWVNSRILLTIIYFLIFVPYGLLSRLFGRDPLTRRQEPGTSYWHKRERPRQAREQFERLF